MDRIKEIYDNATFLVKRIALEKAVRQQLVSTHCLLRIAMDIIQENKLTDDMDKRVDMLASLAENDLCEVKQ